MHGRAGAPERIDRVAVLVIASGLRLDTDERCHVIPQASLTLAWNRSARIAKRSSPSLSQSRRSRLYDLADEPGAVKEDYICSVDWTADGKYLAVGTAGAGGCGGMTQIWDVEAKKKPGVWTATARA